MIKDNRSTIILGIDPGYDRLGIAVIEKIDGKKESVLHSECFVTNRKDDIYQRLFSIGKKIREILDEFNPDSVAIENLFITKNQKTAMRVSEARGIIIFESVSRKIPISEYSPMQIKTAVAGDGTCDKARMMKMIDLLVKIPSKKTGTDKTGLDDEYDAVAVALTHAATSRQ